MFDKVSIMDFFLENVKQLFFPEEWIKLDLKFSKYEIFTLLYIEKKNEVTMSELVDYLNLPMSTATGLIDRLLKNKMVLRERSEQDRRVVLVKLSHQGFSLITSLQTTIELYLSSVTDDLTDEEKQFLFQIVTKILKNFQSKHTENTRKSVSQATLKSINIE